MSAVSAILEKSSALYREINAALGWCESVELAMARFMKANPPVFT